MWQSSALVFTLWIFLVKSLQTLTQCFVPVCPLGKARAPVEARGQAWILFLRNCPSCVSFILKYNFKCNFITILPPFLFLETGSLDDLELADWSGVTGHWAPGSVVSAFSEPGFYHYLRVIPTYDLVLPLWLVYVGSGHWTQVPVRTLLTKPSLQST